MIQLFNFEKIYTLLTHTKSETKTTERTTINVQKSDK